MLQSIKIIFEDDHILVIHKPAGILSVPDRFNIGADHIKVLLEPRHGPIWMVHRLDRNTSGILVLAKSEQAHASLNEAFQSRQVSKKYNAIVHGIPKNIEGLIEEPIAEDPAKRGRYKVHQKGKPAKTGYKIISQWKNFSNLELTLYTGRTHQLRVHLKHLGYPILCDPIYGLEEAVLLSSIKRKRYQLSKNKEELPLLKRQALHASSLTFIHPMTGNEVSFYCELPKDLQALVNQLSKWDR
jgi:23S rRNA pseudouridine1911/1915/1917 synthase